MTKTKLNHHLFCNQTKAWHITTCTPRSSRKSDSNQVFQALVDMPHKLAWINIVHKAVLQPGILEDHCCPTFFHGSLNVPIFHITQPLGIWSIMATFLGDVQYSQHGTFTNPCFLVPLNRLPSSISTLGPFSEDPGIRQQ